MDFFRKTQTLATHLASVFLFHITLARTQAPAAASCPNAMDNFAQQLGFTSAWFAAGLVNKDILAQIKVAREKIGYQYTEHIRWKVFDDFVLAQTYLLPELAVELYRVGENDPHHALAGSMMAAILRRSDCPLVLLDEARNSPYEHLVKIALRKRRYQYAGPSEIFKLAGSSSPRVELKSAADLKRWRASLPNQRHGETLTLTFVVLPEGLYLADRQSEHVACARGAAVFAAGEITFAMNQKGVQVETVAITNQSTGYCPEPESWDAVEQVLEKLGIRHPGAFTTALIFRRCPKCRATNIVKDNWFHCEVCKSELPAEWNFTG